MAKLGGTLFGPWAAARLRKRSVFREVLGSFTTIVVTVAVTVILFLRIFPWIITKLF